MACSGRHEVRRFSMNECGIATEIRYPAYFFSTPVDRLPPHIGWHVRRIALVRTSISICHCAKKGNQSSLILAVEKQWPDQGQ